MTAEGIAGSESGREVRRVVLVGFMASGKSSVGRILARRVGWEFVDVDRLIEEREGRSISEIFRTEGEERFRVLEAETTTEVLARRDVVVATGGGWPAREGRMAGLPAGTVSVWLRVSPEETIRRARRRPGLRPLLGGDDPLGVAKRLAAERDPYYRLATMSISTDLRSPTEVALEIEREIETPAGGL